MDETLQAATEQVTVAEAAAWIAEGNPLLGGVSVRRAFNALLAHPADLPDMDTARIVLARALARSDLNSASYLVDVQVPSIVDIANALQDAARWSRNQDLANLNAAAVIAAQRENDAVMATLTLVAGVSYGDVTELTAESLPTEPSSDWSPRQIRAAFETLTNILTGPWEQCPGDFEPIRPVEFYLGFPPGTDVESPWARVAGMFQDGIPYELLLAQRAVGGGWSTTIRNKVSNRFKAAVTQAIFDAFTANDVTVQLASKSGGDLSEAEMRALTGLSETQVLVRDEAGAANHAIIVSAARDGGTVRKNVLAFADLLPNATIPVSAVVVGPGWAKRNATADFAEALDGRVYTDRTIGDLVEQICHSGRR